MAQPGASPLARLVRARINQMGVSVREAARRCGMPASNLDAIMNSTQGRGFSPELRDRLQALGLTREAVEQAAAATAGYRLEPVGMTAEELEMVLRSRLLSAHDRATVRALLDVMIYGVD